MWMQNVDVFIMKNPLLFAHLLQLKHSSTFQLKIAIEQFQILQLFSPVNARLTHGCHFSHSTLYCWNEAKKYISRHRLYANSWFGSFWHRLKTFWIKQKWNLSARILWTNLKMKKKMDVNGTLLKTGIMHKQYPVRIRLGITWKKVKISFSKWWTHYKTSSRKRQNG